MTRPLRHPEGTARAGAGAVARGRARRWWPLTRRVLTLAFFAAVIGLLAAQARTLDWQHVGAALADYRAPTLLFAAALAAGSFLLYSCYDLIGRVYTGHRVSPRRVMAIAFVSYAFNLNLGPWIGGIAFRYRLYSGVGLKAGIVTRILGMSLTTNWLGYLLLAGTLFTAALVPIPAELIDPAALRALGALLLAVCAAYLAACGWSQRRAWTVRGHELHLPRLRLALTQLCLSTANWLLIAGVLTVLLPAGIGYPRVLGVLLVAAIAGVLAHIPAGLGVIEAVFLTLLPEDVPRGAVLAGMLAFRALYYLLPLLVGIPAFLSLEALAKAQRHHPHPS